MTYWETEAGPLNITRTVVAHRALPHVLAAVFAVEGPSASAVAAGLAGPDAELIFTSVCGKAGTMDVLDFADALGRVAARLRRVYARGAEAASPAELIEKLLARSLSGAQGRAIAPASARATTAARAASVAKAAAAAAVRRQ